MLETNKNRTLRYRAERFRQQAPKKNPIEITHIDGKPIAKTSGNRSRSFSAWPHRLPRPEDPTQRKALRNLAAFFILMLLLTIIARGAAGASLAAVTTTKSSSGEISESVRGTGKVSADGYLYLEAPEELTVRELLAAAGAALKEGDPILRFDPEEIRQRLDRKSIELKEKQLQLDKLLQETPTDSTTLAGAEQTLLWAQQDYADTKTKGDGQIAAAKQAVTDAKTALQAAQQYLNEWKNQPAATPAPSEESGVSAPESDGSLLEQAEAAVDTASANVSSAEAALKETESTVETELKAAAREIERAKQSLESAKTTAATQSQERENEQKQNSVEAEAARLDVEKLKEAITQLETLKTNEGILKAEKEGLVEKLPAIGDKTAEGTAIVTLADTSAGYEAELSVSRSDAEKLTVGGTAEIVKQTGYLYGSSQYEGKILSLSEPDESDMVKVKVSLPEGDFKQGDSLDIRLTSGSSVYDTCLPLGAIHSDSSGYFILVVDKQQTVLGSEEVLRKVPVTVRSTGDDGAAVEGAFTPDEKVVETSTKPVAEGDRVRVES